MDITATLAEHWKYISEGGATIVFSYVGPPHSHFDGMVIRLRKSITSAVIETQDGQDPIIEFQEKCIEKLIPLQYLPSLVSVSFDCAWLERMIALHDVERPEGRRRKDQIDLTQKRGVLATDLVGGNVLAVEIKTKWGFLPTTAHLSEATRQIKTQTCRFCMHSRMKADDEERVSLGYCPLDLFSGDEHRVKTAIYNLWDAWVDSGGTVNNLKIFSRGKQVTVEKMSSMLSDDVDPEEYDGDFREVFTSALFPLVMGTQVLRVLSQLQRTLDALDVEGLSKLRRLAAAHSEELSLFDPKLQQPPFAIGPKMVQPEPTISEWTDFLDTYLSPASAQMDHTKARPENLRYYILAYLLSATFKDCSIIFRLNLLGSSKYVGSEQVKVIDLDRKSIARLDQWEKLDQEIVRGYLAVDNRKVCVDGWV